MRARALRALLPPPPAFGLPVPATPAAPAAPLVALKLGAAVVAAITAAGGAGLLMRPAGAAHTIPPAIGRIAPPPVPRPAPQLIPRPAPPPAPHVVTVDVRTRPRRAAAPHRPPHPRLVPRRRAVHPAPAHRSGGCDLGTIGVCGLSS